ncbi:MAG TPA: primosomal protein N', partial [Aggregatilineales bacterium]|nr:primosomal protein N' [Aggregatilineales bacterium]
MYAELAIYQAPVRTTFHYAIPDELSVQPGHLVEVHFRTGLSQGIVLTTGSESPVAHTKPILTMLLSDPVLTPAQIALGRWMADYYHAPLGACLWLMLPPGVARRGGTLYTLVGVSEALNAGAATVVALLKERGALRAAQLDKALPGVNWRDALRPLLARGQITAVPISPTPDAKAQKVKTVSLNLSAEDAAEIMGRLLKHPKQAAVLNALLERGESLWLSDLAEHTGASYDSIRRLAAKGWITIREEEHLRDPLAGRFYAETVHPPLTPTQAACWEVIRAAMDARSGQTFLLHGVTGSGKTEIYLRAIERALEQGRGAIVLVPEIALVAPTVGRFAGRFPGQTAIVHSSLTEGEQYDTWRRARAGEVRIIIGARSALFTPLPDVGVVIVDEEHDDSYKQSPPLPPPYYHAREVAAALVRETGGVLILGSATPDITTTFRARRGDMTYLTLPQRVVVQGGVTVADAPLPAVQVVDMRRELREGNRGMFSRDLRAALLTVLERDEQAILFLNRRGQATFIMCRDCGYVARCPECDIPLTYHTAHKSGEDRLVCHYCGHTSAPPQTCPQCRSERIRYLGAGTANVAQTVGEEFPAARVIRWDRDTAANRADHESIFERFASGEGNVLVGTQMIVKGLDLPRVTLVGA